MTDLSHEQENALKIARGLAEAGVPIFAAYRNSSTPGTFLYPNGWQNTQAGQPSLNWINRWKPGMALCLVTGVVLDVVDVDPRNGGLTGMAELLAAGAFPVPVGKALTPSAGEHYFIPRTHLAKGKPAMGIDLQAGDDAGEGRGFVFIAPTVRPSKFGELQGQDVPYRWTLYPATNVSPMEQDPALARLVELASTVRRPKKLVFLGAIPGDDGEGFFDTVETWTAQEADRILDGQVGAVQAAGEGAINSALGGAARVFGRFVAGGYVAEEEAVERLLAALKAGGVHSDKWNMQNGKDWTAATCIGAGLARGAEEPWTVTLEPAPAPAPAAGVPLEIQAAPARGAVAPSLLIQSAADMAYHLESALGVGSLSGFFLKDGQVVHTPLVDEIGYVAPREGSDDNGPAQIQNVSPGQLAAKIQFSHRCYKVVDEKDAEGKKTGGKREVNALFPLEASKRAVDAPESMGQLRPLKGITHTPMVRADGSILATPGYDRASGFLFLPGPGVNVPTVSTAPTVRELGEAVALLNEMTAGFPWKTQDDRINYYGALLTPLLRLVTPPTYKMFGIGAHQPGSGKTLLADVLTILHGGVLRTEMPEDEPEMRKQTTSILASTSAPVVHIDNVTGVLKSSTLAGLLTAGQALQDRELGSSRMITTLNDRMWVVTGNNLSLGGDLIRRTIIITIDPNMANPETRSFAIGDLKGWTRTNRNRLLHALLTIVAAWVDAGRPLERRAQSDSFALWEASLGGMLAHAGVPGVFDAETGKQAAAGGDDDALSGVLEHLWERFADREWSVVEALSSERNGDAYDFTDESRDWLPGMVIEKLGRNETAGRKTFGYWLRNRVGRWITTSDGISLVIRAGGKGKLGQLWSVEKAS